MAKIEQSSPRARVVTIDPVGRTEGHLGITITVRDHEIVEAQAFSPLYRGFEKLMIGRDPREAQELPTRICGVCPMVHSVCGSKSIEMLLGVPYNDNARVMRNLAHATHMVGDHMLHFYHLAALDFAKGPEKAPFAPRYEGDYRLPKALNDRLVGHYIEALHIRRISHEASALFAGKLPHAISFVPGGVTVTPTRELIAGWRERVLEIQKFAAEAWLPDVRTVAEHYADYFEIGTGTTNYLCMGAFEMDSRDEEHFYAREARIDGTNQPLDLASITEDVAHSWQEGRDGRRPSDPDTKRVDPDKEAGYTFMTAIRYRGEPMEVGPFARMKLAGRIDGEASVMGRHLARALEGQELAAELLEWAGELEPDHSGMIEAPPVPETGQSHGLSEAPRGACAHFMKVDGGRISHWQAIPATNWNGSPRDARGRPGPFEQALVGTPIADPEQPIEAVRVVRSFDPCMACAVHVITPERDLGEFIVNE